MKRFFISIAIFNITFITFAQLNMGLLGKLEYTNDISDVWGYVDETGNEYALVGVYEGLSIVDVTEPANPVEVYFGNEDPSIWRDIKTWGDYAYVSSESTGGVFIVDMSPLPDGEITNTSFFTGSGYPFSDAHNIYIDENGRLYIFGADNGNGGAIICDLTQDPMNPVELGRFNDYYLHDGMVKNNILYGSAIYNGFFAMVDVTNPAAPFVMATAYTPGNFTHNSWVSDNGNYVFTTDEVGSGYVAAYDVSDINNIAELDKVQSNPGSGVIPHNTHFMNDFIITSYYKDGVVIHDVSNPADMIEVANFDTSPFSGGGYAGCWGVYPFLPSGNILASDIEEGLYILSVDYKHASRIEGIVLDSISGEPLSDVIWSVTGIDFGGQTDNTGTFGFGTLEEGTFTFEFSKEGYDTKVLDDVILENGVVTNLNVEMSYSVTTGIENPEQIGLAVYPNPFRTQIVAEYFFDSPVTTGASYRIYDLTGRIVEEKPVTEQTGRIVAGSNLQSGIYFISIQKGNEVSDILKVIKE